MPARHPSAQALATLAAELAALPDLPRAELKQRWQELYGIPCPVRMSRKLLRYAIAYRLQERVYGGLDKKTLRRLEKAAASLAAGRSLGPAGPRIKPGTRLLREWQGTVHEVIVLEKGVRYRGKAWPSLSAVAREITGARWSGPRFFGLKEAA
ncbi:MAG: DUF2924 domain-containing protein [Sandaracinus sp.]|nr:DUF2924 domain-containing protein [Sandaracinus sp.]